jgi:hypothetical protein
VSKFFERPPPAIRQSVNSQANNRCPTYKFCERSRRD